MKVRCTADGRVWTGLWIILTFSEQFGIQTHTNHLVALKAQHAEKHDFSTVSTVSTSHK